MTDSKDKLFSRIIGGGQLLVMVTGIATILMLFGAKNEQLTGARADIEKLAEAVNDLARTQASASVADATHTRALEDILRRLDSLEGNRK